MYAPQSFSAALKLLGIGDPAVNGARVDRIEMVRDHWIIWYSFHNPDGSVQTEGPQRAPRTYKERRRYSE